MQKFLLFLSILILFATPAHAKVRSAKLAVDIPAGKSKTIRLKNLPTNAAVKVEVKSDGAVTIFLMDQKNFEEYPDINRPLFQSKVIDNLSFTVNIPSSGHYYLVLDNVLYTRPVKVDVNIHGASSADSMLLDKYLPSEKKKAIEKNLGKIGLELRKLFIFEPFPVSAGLCGTDDPFRKSDGIILCLEFVKKINEFVDSKEKATNILLFTIFHEVGHKLLSQWRAPFSDNDEVADEFATLLIVMTGEAERLSPAVEYFSANISSIHRAQNIIRWMKNPDRFKSWQTILIPHMQTDILEQLKDNPLDWLNHDLIERELLTRKTILLGPAGYLNQYSNMSGEIYPLVPCHLSFC